MTNLLKFTLFYDIPSCHSWTSPIELWDQPINNTKHYSIVAKYQVTVLFHIICSPKSGGEASIIRPQGVSVVLFGVDSPRVQMG